MDRRYARLILNIVIPMVEILLLCLLGPKLLKFFMPFVIGWIIAMIANPLVRFLESKVKIVRKHSSALIVIAVLALIIGLGYFLISRLFQFLKQFFCRDTAVGRKNKIGHGIRESKAKFRQTGFGPFPGIDDFLHGFLEIGIIFHSFGS